MTTLKRRLYALGAAAVRRGMPPRWFGYRDIRRETLREHFDRRGEAAGCLETIHQLAVASNPLPCNVEDRAQLPDEAGWWGYSFRDVPTRRSGETLLATLPNCRVAWYWDQHLGGEFQPVVVTRDDRALDLREMRFRPRHGEVLRGSVPVRVERATWILERVYDNHSHWLTAHLPKLALLEQRGELDDVLLPTRRTAALDASLRLLGADPARFRTINPDRPLEVGELTIMETDRFRPELLRLVQELVGGSGPAPHRRVYISRANASRRRLLNEDKIWPLLAQRGFERVHLEELTFQEQVDLMREAKVICAPHGAGLTNMLFAPPGAEIVELADLSFPNPNFYALASGLGHHYWLVEAEGVGDGHPLERDLQVARSALDDVLSQVAPS